MKLTEQEKQQLLQATSPEQAHAARPPKPRLLSPEEYFARIEQFAQVFPKKKKPVFFGGDHWRL